MEITKTDTLQAVEVQEQSSVEKQQNKDEQKVTMPAQEALKEQQTNSEKAPEKVEKEILILNLELDLVQANAFIAEAVKIFETTVDELKKDLEKIEEDTELSEEQKQEKSREAAAAHFSKFLDSLPEKPALKLEQKIIAGKEAEGFYNRHIENHIAMFNQMFRPQNEVNNIHKIVSELFEIS